MGRRLRVEGWGGGSSRFFASLLYFLLCCCGIVYDLTFTLFICTAYEMLDLFSESEARGISEHDIYTSMSVYNIIL